MKNVFLIVFIGLLWINPAHSESPSWQNKGGKPVSEIESVKSKDGFTGSVLAVTDQDWKQKWNTPPETKPNFNKAGVVSYGTKVFILIFFSNPAQDDQQISNVRCDLKIINSAGSAILSRQDMACFSGRVAGSLNNRYLSVPVISFVGDPADPVGTWVIEVNLRDAVRKVELPLRTTFELITDNSSDNSDKATGDVGKQPALPAQMDLQMGSAIKPMQSEVAVLEKYKFSVETKPEVKESSVKVENWVVNLIAYKQDQLAERKAEEFAAKGISAKVNKVEAKGEVWYRLSVDGFESQYEAAAYAARAKKMLNLDSVWLNRNKN